MKEALLWFLGRLDFRPAGMVGLALGLGVGYYLNERDLVMGAAVCVVIGSFGGTWLDNQFRTGERIRAWWKEWKNRG